MTVIYYKPPVVVGPSVIYYKAPPSTPLSRLSPGASLSPGDSLVSPNGVYRFTLQKEDGNLVLYRNLSALWDSATVNQGGLRLDMQTDGNLVLYDVNGVARWATMTQGNPGAFFQVQDDGNAVVYGPQGNALWDSRTWGGIYHEEKGSWLSEACKTIAKPFAELPHNMAQAWSTVADTGAQVPIIGPALHGALVIVGGPFAFTDRIVAGERLDRALIADFRDKISGVREVAPYAQIVISFVPGIGAGVSAAIGAGLALAQGMPIDQAILEGVKDALPGGPAAHAAFSLTVAAASGENLLQAAGGAGIEALGLGPEATKAMRKTLNVAYKAAQGENVPMAALEEAREYLPNEGTKKAFDVAVALAQGKRLQDTLVEEVKTISADQIAKIQRVGQDAISSNKALQDVYSGLQTVSNRGSGIGVYARTARDGYEYGVGLMRHAGTNEAILNAARAQMTPVEQKGFDMAIAAHRTAVTTRIPESSPPDETAAYVVAKGLAGNPNPMIKTEAVKMFLVSPNATVGMTRAIAQTKPRQSLWGWLKRLFHL